MPPTSSSAEVRIGCTGSELSLVEWTRDFGRTGPRWWLPTMGPFSWERRVTSGILRMCFDCVFHLSPIASDVCKYFSLRILQPLAKATYPMHHNGQKKNSYSA